MANASTVQYRPLASPTASSSSFVSVCSSGHGLCLGTRSFSINGATGYGAYTNPSAEVSLAKQASLNVLELVEFDCQYHVLADTESTCTWNRVDAYIAAAEAAGMHVILNLSEYGQSLAAAGDNPCTTDWGPYLNFVANRVSTVTGRTYKNDPGIAMMELWGEIPAPNYSGAVCTTSQMQSFYSKSLAEWAGAAPNILGSTGGFSYINDPNSGIPWQAIMADPNDKVCAVEINSAPDRDTSFPNVLSYCSGLAPNKPTFISAWSSCRNVSQYPGDISHYTTDSGGASHATAMINLGKTANVVGTDFWNLKNDPTEQTGSCDIGTQTPKTLAAVTAGD